MPRTLSGAVRDREGYSIPGANIHWLGTTTGGASDGDGNFEIARRSGQHQLVVSFIGFNTDTISIAPEQEYVDVVLSEGVALAEVQVVTRRLGQMKLRSSALNADVISSDELCRAACCNLGESFVTNPSVDVNYSDAATGAKQIRLLGLSGTYVQMLTENIPNFRGASAAYGLGYVPGPWMNSIQVSKGTASVKNGYESLTGQINIEYKKPQVAEADWVSANVFASSSQRYEANVDASVKMSDKLSTMVLAHYENETAAHDADGDGFADVPQVQQYNVFNRWAYMAPRYKLQAGARVLGEWRSSGQVHASNDMPRYGIDMRTNRYEGFLKQAFIFNQEHNTNLALILSGQWHDLDASFGHRMYGVKQQNLYGQLLFETEFSKKHALSVGLNITADRYRQQVRLSHNLEEAPEHVTDREEVGGAYAQYTFTPTEKLTVMAGLRGDYSSLHGFFVTPRANVRYAPCDIITFRVSVGKGYRTNHVLAENNFLLASSRRLVVKEPLEQESAWNAGTSIATYIPVGQHTLQINAEYYHTWFQQQMVVDLDSHPHEVVMSNLHGRSYSHVFQIEAIYPFFEGFNLTAAWRLTDVKHTVAGVLREKPLVSRFKGLLSASYKTPLGLWQFDATLQLNGGGRMPDAYQLEDGSMSWAPRFKGYQQLSAQITRYFRNWSVYLGGENLTNFTQKNAIIGADNPWGDRFDATMVWGPMHGIKGYIGVRYNLPRK